MANALYDLGRQAFLEGEIDWADDNIKVLLVDTADYVVNLATDQYHSDVTAAGIVATSGNLGSKTVTNGVADAADVTFSAVTGDASEALVIYKDSGASATSPLIAYIDTASAGLPVTPDGGDITVQWDSGANKIFKL
jgi:hypothetical protein